VGKGVVSPENHTAQEGALGGSGLTPPVKPYRVHCKLEEAIEKPCTDILAHTESVERYFVGSMDTWLPRIIMTHGEYVQAL
jgi:hypothetical protein